MARKVKPYNHTNDITKKAIDTKHDGDSSFQRRSIKSTIFRKYQKQPKLKIKPPATPTNRPSNPNLKPPAIPPPNGHNRHQILSVSVKVTFPDLKESGFKTIENRPQSSTPSPGGGITTFTPGACVASSC